MHLPPVHFGRQHLIVESPVKVLDCQCVHKVNCIVQTATQDKCMLSSEVPYLENECSDIDMI
jgi:hypothetical protein